MIVAGTGHRPNKLGGHSEAIFNKILLLAKAALIKHEPSKVISGMALGWDQALAYASAELGVPFIAAVPCEGQEKMWPPKSQASYKKLLERAIEIKVVCPGPYEAWKMQKRNCWMVDNAEVIFALWDGSKGGTGNCVEYAQKQNKRIINFFDIWKTLGK